MIRIIMEQIRIYIACIAAIPAALGVGHLLFTGLSGFTLVVATLASFVIAVFLINRLLSRKF